jgi:SNF2 family DNA or RNA helicase
VTTLPIAADYQYKQGAPAPFDHQRAGFEATRDKEAYGIFWEQRCGKSRVVLDTAAHLYQRGSIDALLLVTPPGVQHTWILEQIPKWLSIPARTLAYSTAQSGNKRYRPLIKELVNHAGFSVMAMSFQSFMSGQGKADAWAFLKKRTCLYAVDEAHHIKTPGAKRTISIIASGKYAPYRRILTGTPVSEGPFDVYSQIKFLDPGFWKRHHMHSFSAFKTHFGIFLTQEQCIQTMGYVPNYPVFHDYRNIPELKQLLATISHRVTQDEVLHLPPALYQTRFFEMTPKQARLYNQLKTEYEIEIESGVFISAALSIVRHGRLQQIASGYIPDDSGEPRSTIEPDRTDPRLALLLETLEDMAGEQVVIFCQYRLDIARVMALLGKAAVSFIGGKMTAEEGAANIAAFRAGEARYFVTTYAKGSEGNNLATARNLVFFSHTQKAVQRSQAAERIKEPGQKHHCNYVDLIGRDTVDEGIVQDLRDKRDVSAAITGDTLKEWI